MDSDAAVILQDLHGKFQELTEYVTDKASEQRKAHEVELTLFRQLLLLGAQLLKLFFVHRASTTPSKPVHAADGAELKQHDRRDRVYFSVFGKISFKRPYFYRKGYDGMYPLDAKLNLPRGCYSYLLVDWANYCVTDESFDESIGVLDHILGISMSKGAAETIARENAEHVEGFYEQKEPPQREDEGPILVIQADGKGVPMKREGESEEARGRLGKGEKRGKKKESIVTAIYTIVPYVRTAQEVVKALLWPEKRKETQAAVESQRPRPVGKEVRATLEGKDTALERLGGKVEQRDGEYIQDRVALSDGADALQTRICKRFPGFTLILDIIHASEYLWKVVNALLGEKHPERTQWVGKQLLEMLSGKTEQVIERLRELAESESVSTTQKEVLQSTIGYYERNLPYMNYSEYLSRGWPIGTGVVEGACGHLVKDRMERSGMQWTKSGAQAVLDLRSVRVNADWEEYQVYHRRCEQQRLYGNSAGASCGTGIAETEALRSAA